MTEYHRITTEYMRVSPFKTTFTASRSTRQVHVIPHMFCATHRDCFQADRAAQSEEERIDELNDVVQEMLDDRVVLVPDWPPDDEDEPRVLDCGVGKGAWVDSLLNEHDDCDVCRLSQVSMASSRC